MRKAAPIFISLIMFFTFSSYAFADLLGPDPEVTQIPAETESTAEETTYWTEVTGKATEKAVSETTTEVTTASEIITEESLSAEETVTESSSEETEPENQESSSEHTAAACIFVSLAIAVMAAGTIVYVKKKHN